MSYKKPSVRGCEQCDKLFTARDAYGRSPVRFCSPSCIMKSRNAADPGLAKRANAAAVPVIIARLRGSGSAGYVKENGRHQHRVVAERMLGRPLRRGEVVHHKDENKKNNNPSNLVVLTKAAHMREHGIGIPGMTLWWKPWTKRRTKKGNSDASV